MNEYRWPEQGNYIFKLIGTGAGFFLVHADIEEYQFFEHVLQLYTDANSRSAPTFSFYGEISEDTYNLLYDQYQLSERVIEP